MAKKKKRIPLNETPASLNDAFGSLPLDELTLPAPKADEVSATNKSDAPAYKSLCLRRETKHRGGKSVVVVYDFPRVCRADAIESLARELKQHCGCGGTVKNREIQIQGEKAAEITAFLQARGVRVRGLTS